MPVINRVYGGSGASLIYNEEDSNKPKLCRKGNECEFTPNDPDSFDRAAAAVGLTTAEKRNLRQNAQVRNLLTRPPLPRTGTPGYTAMVHTSPTGERQPVPCELIKTNRQRSRVRLLQPTYDKSGLKRFPINHVASIAKHLVTKVQDQ